MNRRRFSMGLAASALAFGHPRSSLAAGAVFSPGDVLENLARSIWIPSRPGASRVAYVIAAPWCDVCETLHHQQKALGIDCDFRFIFTDPRDPAQARRASAAMAAGRGGDLSIIYGNVVAPDAPAPDFALQVNGVTVSMMRKTIMRETNFPRVGYPTIVAPVTDGVYMFAGIPDGLAAVADTFSVHPSAALSRSPIRYLASEPPHLMVAGGLRYARAEGAALHAAPDKAAPKLQSIDAGFGHNLVGTTTIRGEDWLAFQVFSTGTPYLWGYAAEFEE